MATKLNAAAALNAAKNTQGGEVIETTLNNTASEQATQSEQAQSEQAAGVKFTLNTPNPYFINYLGTASEEFAADFEKFASEFIASEFTRPETKNAGKAFDSLLNLLISSEFLLNSENFAKYMSEKNPLGDYTRSAIKNARDYARAQLALISEFGSRAEKAWQNYNRANKAPTNAELKAANAEKDAQIAELMEKLATAQAAAAAAAAAKGA